MASLCMRIQNFFKSTERAFLWHLGFRNPPDSFAVALTCGSTIKVPATEPKFSLDELLKDPFVWAVPKHRRSIFRRRIRRFGSVEGYYKMLLPQKNLVVCVDCGNHKEVARLCPTCYAKVKTETEAMQEAIQKDLGLSPVENEVVVLYDGENADTKNEFWKGKRIVEMKKQRPSWFGRNLLQPTTQAPATTAAVEPKDLA